MNKQILLYRKGAGLTNADMDALREAGIVPIRVNRFEDVRVVDPMQYGDKSAVWLAAMQAISQANDKVGVKTLFGRLLAEKLSAVDVPKSLDPL